MIKKSWKIQKFIFLRLKKNKCIYIISKKNFNFTNGDGKIITSVTISKISEQFIIHGKNEEYDYLYISPNRLKIIKILEEIYESITQNELLFSIANEKDLTKYLVGKSERKNLQTYTKFQLVNLCLLENL